MDEIQNISDTLKIDDFIISSLPYLLTYFISRFLFVSWSDRAVWDTCSNKLPISV